MYGRDTITSFARESQMCQTRVIMAVAPLMEVEIMTKIKGKNDAITFAAIKMVEQLFHDGQIPANTLRGILDEYSDCVDTSKFRCSNEKKKDKNEVSA